MSTIDAPGATRRLTTETKQAFRTTEFWIYVLLLLAVLIAGAVTGDDGGVGASGGDPMNAGQTWLYAVILTAAYLVSRGLAKAGSQDPYWDAPEGGSGSGLTDRVKAAATVLREGEQPSSSSSAPTTRMPPA